MVSDPPAMGMVCVGGRFSVIAIRNTIMASIELMPRLIFSPDSHGSMKTISAEGTELRVSSGQYEYTAVFVPRSDSNTVTRSDSISLHCSVSHSLGSSTVTHSDSNIVTQSYDNS